MIADKVAAHLDAYLAAEPDSDRAREELRWLESALEYLLADLLLEQHGVSEGFDGFTGAPNGDRGRRVTADGALEMTGGAYVFGPNAVWPFRARLAPHPRESIFWLSDQSGSVATGGASPIGKNAPRHRRARAHRAREKHAAGGGRLSIPPQPHEWQYVMTTTLPPVHGLGR